MTDSRLSSSASSYEERNEARLQRIEMALAHLQHDVDSLNSSLLRHFHRLQEFEARFGRIEHELQVSSDPTERPDASADRPPHY